MLRRIIRQQQRALYPVVYARLLLARVAGIQAAGKTGTAQNPHGKSHAWFIGFAPFEEPRIAIAVLVENVGYGGSYAAPIAGLCFDQYLKGSLVRFDRPAAPPVAVGPSDRPPLSVLAGEGTAR